MLHFSFVLLKSDDVVQNKSAKIPFDTEQKFPMPHERCCFLDRSASD